MNVSVIVIILSLGMIGLISIPVFAQEVDDLDYEIRGGTILNFEIDSKTASLIISLDARARGELTITLPRYLIDAKSGSDDVDFDIFVSGFHLNSFDEVTTPFERTVTIPFKRSNSELIITGTHVFSQLPVTQTIQQQSTYEMIISEHLNDSHDGNAELLIFSDTTWSGALQSSSFDYTDIDGQNDDSVIFDCESSLGRQGVFGAKIKKLTQDGFLKIVVIQNKQIVSQGETTEEFGEVLINGNCKSESSSAPGGGGCLIATATFGSEMAPQVQQLRELRDNTLLKSESGKNFMNSFNGMYYSFSPVIADLERENPLFKEAVKLFITPMISSLSLLNYVNMDSEESVLGYGISLIVLNLAMYVGIPASVIIGIKKKF